MLVDIVSVQTKDGIRLHGSHRRADIGVATALPIDVLVMHHGVAGNFYGIDLFDDLSELAVAAGCAVIRANNRGHDLASWAVDAAGGRTRSGAAYEIMADSLHDWDAWIGFAADQGYKRIGVLGHSLGAVKTIYYFANRDDERVRLAVALSPPRLSYGAFLRSPDGPEFSRYVETARKRIEVGDRHALIDATLPMPFLGSAATYYDKYGPEENANILARLSNVKLPLLATHGTKEAATEPSMRAVLQELTRLAGEIPNFSYAIVPDADHFYTGLRANVWSVVREWLRSLP